MSSTRIINFKPLVSGSTKKRGKLKGNSIKYNGVNINYYSETEKIHIGKKKFGTADEALEYLKGESSEESSEERVDPEFEAKNYKLSHRHKRIK